MFRDNLKFTLWTYLFFALSGISAQELNNEIPFLDSESVELNWELSNVNNSSFFWEIKLPDQKRYGITKKTHDGGNKPIDLVGNVNGKKFKLSSCNTEKNSIRCKFFDEDSISVSQYISNTSDDYVIEVVNELINLASASYSESDDFLRFTIGPGFGRNDHPKSSSYSEQLIASIDSKVFNIPREDEDVNLSKLDWIGFENRYFAFIVIPSKTISFANSSIRYSFDSSTNLPIIEFDLPLSNLESNQNAEWKFKVFAGPKSINILSNTKSADLKSILFPNQWKGMKWLCLCLYKLLLFLFGVIKNWGLAIITLAILVRMLLSPVSKWAQKSQDKFVAAQEKMKPELQFIKENYKGGEQSERTLRLYKKYNVSPFSGLKPLLVVMLQLPILIGLFHVLGSVFELREASFLWIETLAEPDRLFKFGFNIPFLGEYFNFLPFLMSGVSLIAFKFSPASVSNNKEKSKQNYFLIGMTIIFFFLFYAFPAGMVLYWTCANFFQVVHQKLSFL